MKRVYDRPGKDDGYRVLVDRLWPRGLTKEKARIDEWAKDIAPPDDLRKWFHRNDSKWEEFRIKYRLYLSEVESQIEPLVARSRGQKVTLLFASKRLELNNATVLKEYLDERLDSFE